MNTLKLNGAAKKGSFEVLSIETWKTKKMLKYYLWSLSSALLWDKEANDIKLHQQHKKKAKKKNKEYPLCTSMKKNCIGWKNSFVISSRGLLSYKTRFKL